MRQLIFGTLALLLLVTLVSCGSKNKNPHLYRYDDCNLQSGSMICEGGQQFDIPEDNFKEEEDTDSCQVVETKKYVYVTCGDTTREYKKKCNNGKGNGPEGCSPSEKGNNDEK